jgi:glycerate kinase
VGGQDDCRTGKRTDVLCSFARTGQFHPFRVFTPTPEKIRHARQMIDSGQQSVSGMAKLLGVHRVTLHKALKRTAER